MTCSECKNWYRGVRITYGNGEIIDNFRDRPTCKVLNGTAETPADFHCNHFEQGTMDDQIDHEIKGGAPFENWVYGPCPECNAVGSKPGSTACNRCAGTSKVRYYDDGFVGEEQHRLHPMEVKMQKAAEVAKLYDQIRQLQEGIASTATEVDPTKLNLDSARKGAVV